MLHMSLVALAFAATALAASGCSESSKTGSTAAATATVSAAQVAATPPPTVPPAKVATGTPLTRSELIAQAEAVCTRVNAKSSALVANNVQEFTRTFPQLAIYNRTEAAELSKLVPPAAMAHVWVRMIDDLQLHSQYVSEVARDLEQKNKIAATRFVQANKVIENLVETAKQAGFDHCSKLS